MRHFELATALATVLAVFFAGSPPARAELLETISYDFLPYQGTEEPIVFPDGTLADDVEVRLSKLKVGLTYSTVLPSGRTVLVNEISYHLIELDYRKHELARTP